MSVAAADAKSIFGNALELEPAARPVYLDEACAGDPGLRARIDELLDAHGRVGEFMDQPVPAGITGSYARLTERAGALIGPYKLLQQIGEGGMGTVFMAEQAERHPEHVAGAHDAETVRPGLAQRPVSAAG